MFDLKGTIVDRELILLGVEVDFNDKRGGFNGFHNY